MDFKDFMEKVILGGQDDKEVGDKICDLTAFDRQQWQALEELKDKLNEKMSELQEECQELDLLRKKWWRRIRKEHTIQFDNIHYEEADNAVYQRVKKKR